MLRINKKQENRRRGGRCGYQLWNLAWATRGQRGYHQFESYVLSWSADFLLRLTRERSSITSYRRSHELRLQDNDGWNVSIPPPGVLPRSLWTGTAQNAAIMLARTPMLMLCPFEYPGAVITQPYMNKLPSYLASTGFRNPEDPQNTLLRVRHWN